MVSKLVEMPLESLKTNGLAQRCSRMILKYADAFAKLSLLLFEQKLDLTRLWPFTGYGAFVVGNLFAVRTSPQQRPYLAHALGQLMIYFHGLISTDLST